MCKTMKALSTHSLLVTAIPLLSLTLPFRLDISLLPHLGYTLVSDTWGEQTRLYSPLKLEVFENKISPNVKYIIKQTGKNMYKK